MNKNLRRYAVGALAIGAIAGGAAIGLPATATAGGDWHPVTYGLSVTPASLLPATVSSAAPVRVVSTALDKAGKPVVSVRTATNRADATELVEAGQSAKNAVGVELDAVATATDVPSGTDPYRSQQWDLAKMRVGDAWKAATGSGIVVAVLDTGVEASHPDLAGKVLPGIDETTGGTTGVSADPNGHGTHVAGTIAAVTGNGVGIAGIAPDTKILPVRVLGANGSGYMSDTAAGIVWAADHGANVINMSLGASTQVSAVTNAIAYARSKGVVVVAAAGNDRQKGSPTSWPGADPGVIGVAATDGNDVVATYSNAGSYVDVAAPGSNILSTVPVSKGSYSAWNGTSMASPHVAALAALLKSANRSLTPDQVESVMETTATDLGAAGKDNDYGYGRVDATAALAAVTKTPATTPPASTAPTTVPTTKAPEPTKPAPTTKAPEPTKPTPTTKAPEPTKPVTPTPTTRAAEPTKPAPTTPPAPVKKANPYVRGSSTSGLSVLYGATGTFTWTITAGDKPLAARPVQVGVTAPGGSGFVWKTLTTDAAGQVAFSQPILGRTQVQLVVPATEATNPLTMSPLVFTARVGLTVKKTDARSLAVDLTGLDRQTVQVQRLNGDSWVTVASYPAQATRTVTGLVAGAQYRVFVPTTTGMVGATSSAVRMI